ncbi:hypothetical protein ACH4S8_26555 [Streptomyces sp. NPDC021080]|uniref:hypothetical protein n=1 Tax=Streptomyces sp. NPDC021080 TaxID=3365110 RepID=UPI0037919463
MADQPAAVNSSITSVWGSSSWARAMSRPTSLQGATRASAWSGGNIRPSASTGSARAIIALLLCQERAASTSCSLPPVKVASWTSSVITTTAVASSRRRVS